MIRKSGVNNTCITCQFNIDRYDDQTIYIYMYSTYHCDDH